jgi:hypothetical protein
MTCSDGIVETSLSHNDSGNSTGQQTLTHIRSSGEINPEMDSLHSSVENVPEENMISLCLDPSFSAPDINLNFYWLFENGPSRFTSNADEGLPEVSPARTSSSGISPPSFPMTSQTIRLPVPSETPSFSPCYFLLNEQN